MSISPHLLAGSCKWFIFSNTKLLAGSLCAPLNGTDILHTFYEYLTRRDQPFVERQDWFLLRC